MRGVRFAFVAAVGVVVTGLAGIVAAGLFDQLDFDTFDRVVGLLGILGLVTTLAAAIRPGWARLPLLLSGFYSFAMADSGFQISGPCDCIDLTGFVAPILVIVGGLGALALRARERRSASPESAR